MISASGPPSVGIATADEPPPGSAVPGPAAVPARRRTIEGRGYALGGAHVLGIPYDEYIMRTGAEWFPGLDRQIVDYPAGQVQGTPWNGCSRASGVSTTASRASGSTAPATVSPSTWAGPTC